ncbi:MAG TPA: M48 family metallopeptidase [Verrucomicrobiae bacterium]|nr:M48 family metallopeptidase [Verrucomicrobiae bacterium]
MSRRPVRIALILNLLVFGALAQNRPKAPKDNPDAIGDRDVCGGINFYGLPAEMAMGKQMAQMVARDAKLMTDPRITEYVNRLVQNVVQNSDAKMPVTVQVIDDETINAFTLPGGYIFVDVGLLLAADTEAQLAGALAHEVGHVVCRHGTRQATNGDLTRIGATIASIAVGGWPAVAIGQGANAVIPLQYVKFSQRFETDADFYGLQYMYKAGYDPSEMVNFFEKIESMERKKPGTIGKFFATHPMTDDRLKKSQIEIDRDLAARPEYVVNTSEFDEVKARLSEMRNQRKVESSDPSRPTLRRRD